MAQKTAPNPAPAEEPTIEEKKKRKHFLPNRNIFLDQEEGPKGDVAEDLVFHTITALDVQPSEIIFKDVEPGQIYQMTVVVKNLTKLVKRIRVFQPKNSCFRCDYAMLGPIASGMSIELVVSYESEEKGKVEDFITIISDNRIKHTVKLSAYSPMAKIIFEPFVNFGFIQSGKTKSESVLFKNEGSVEGRVSILADDIKDLKVEPKGTFLLQKNEFKRVTFSYTPREPGIFRGEIPVETDGKPFTTKIDVNATCVEFLRFIIDEEGEVLNKIDFGTILYGQKQKLTGHLVNNSPEGFYFQITYLQGLHSVYREENNILTPHEQGIQQTKRQLHIEPTEGYVNSYDQIPLKFICKTYVEEDHQIWARNYAMGGHKDDHESKDLHKSINLTAVFFFKKDSYSVSDEKEENRVLMMQAEASCPKVSFELLTADFGKVLVGTPSVIECKIQNDGKQSSVRVDCPKLSVFNCSLDEIVLKPQESYILKITFLPKNFGKISIEAHFVINKQYSIPFRFVGTGKPKNDAITKSESRILLPPMAGADAVAEQTGLSAVASSFDFLKQERQRRLHEKNQKLLKKQMSTLELKAKELMPKLQSQKNSSGQDIPADDLVLSDLKYLFNEHRNGLDSPRPEIPKKVDSLYVIKPIGKYEPLDKGDMDSFNPDPNLQLRKLPDKLSSHAMMREVNQPLTNEMLKHVQAGPKTLDFGRVFVSSRTKKYFHIRNEMKCAIKARMILEDEELKESDESVQVIMTGQSATFQLVFMSKKVMEFNKIMRYLINDKHSFKYIVKATIVPVDLEVSEAKLDLTFPDDVLELTTSKHLSLRNTGNDVAHFDWYSPSPALFKIEPMSGFVEPMNSKLVKVSFTPNGLKQVEEEVLDLRIRQGNSKSVVVVGTAVNTVCECSPSMLNFGSIAVGEVTKLSFNLVNHNTRNSAVFLIDQKSLGPNVRVSPPVGKVPPDSSFKLEFEFSSIEQVASLNRSFNILIRGSKPVTVGFIGNVIVPRVVIHERAFDFGTITYGNSATLPLTIENTSPIVAKLNMDLKVREEDPNTEQFGCLKIVQDRSRGDDSLVIEERDVDHEEAKRKKDKEIEQEKKEIMNQEKSLDDIMPSKDSDSEEDNADRSYASDLPENSDCFVITLKPNKTYHFLLTFTPHLTQTYNFSLPLTLNGFKEYTDLLRPVACAAVHPRIILDPIDGIRDFKKKTITQVEGAGPDTLSLKISNPDPAQQVRFFIDTKELDENKLFHLSKTEGVVPARTSIDITVEYRPTIPGVWNCQLPLYVDDERSAPKALISLRGESSFPRILFDRREIIMPTVPLGVESKVTFYVYNDGYQTVSLKAHFIETFQHFPIKIDFPEGPGLNSKKQKLKVELAFVAKNPLSFTTQLFVEDDQKTSYPIFVSGTADNSLLTNYSYFLRTPKEDYEVVLKEDKPLAIKLPDKEGSVKSEKISATGSKLSGAGTAKIGLGYPPVPFDVLERACKHTARFLGTFVPGVKSLAFPADFIANNGDPLIRVVEFFSKSPLGIKNKFNQDLKKLEKVTLLQTTYSAVITFLKKEGAFLNSIRPEYLMSWADLQAYYKKAPAANATPHANRLSESAHKYLSLDSWLVLINQVFKLYLVSKVNVQRFKAIPVLPEPLKKLPPGLDASTVLSVSEQLLVRWAEAAVEKIRDDPRRLNILSSAFDKTSFQNGIPYGALAQLYTAGSWQPLRKMKDLLIMKTEVYENMHVILETFTDMGLHYIPDPQEVASIDPREIVLFLAYLFNSLPNYLPKETVLFECKIDDTVSKKITLHNPTTQLLSYVVMLDANEDFSIKDSAVKVEPRLDFDFLVSFKGRISKPVKGRIIFKPKNEGGDILMSPIVYDLSSKIVGRYTSERFVFKDVMLYDNKFKEIKISNPFTKDCDFYIQMEHLPSTPGEVKKRRYGGTSLVAQNRREPDKRLLPHFFCTQEKIQIRRGKSVKLKLTYLPLTFEVHHCNIVLIDEEVGELQYELIGIPLYPAPIQTTSISNSIESAKPELIYMSIIYKAKHIAYTQAAKLASSVRDDKVRQALTAFLGESREEESFRVECSAPKEFSYPSTFTIYSNKKTDVDKEAPPNSMQIGLNFRYPVKDFVMMLIMRNSDLTDVRVYECNVTLLPKAFKATLDFNTPVKIALEQSIPVSNPTDNEVLFSVSRDDAANGDYFQFSRNLKVKPQTTEVFNVTFLPLWKGNASTVLKIQNPVTREEFHYALKGVADEPLAENHFSIKCNVGEEKKVPILIENSEPTHKDYSVSIEAYGIAGPDRIRVDANSKATYVATVKPVLGGVYAGCITLTDQTKHYIWYTFELEYQGRKNIRNYEVTGVIRRDNPFEIEVENQNDERLDYKVHVKGEGLSGPDYITVPAKSKAMVAMSFFPLRLLDTDGSVVISNSKVGEILCKVYMKSTEPTPVKLPLLKCEVGKTAEHLIELDNPSAKPVRVTLQNFASDNFVILEREFELAPRETREVKMTYSPTEIDVQNSVELVFLTENMGSWKFLAFGKGLYPTSYPLKEYVLELQKDSSGIVVFKNPFKVGINISVRLELADPKDEGVFELINKKTKVSLNAGASVQIPISFYPTEIKDYNCSIVVFLNEKISWRYPIKVITESKNKAVELHISTQCRKKVEKEFAITLPGLTTLDPNEAYHMELFSVAKGEIEAVRKWFSVLTEKANLDVETRQLRFTVKFLPQKPLKTLGEVLITRNSGGKWRYASLTRYKIQLESTEPETLDLIEITSPLNVTSSVTFNLASEVKTGEKFTAEFTYDSAPEFTVIPKSGMLQSVVK